MQKNKTALSIFDVIIQTRPSSNAGGLDWREPEHFKLSWGFVGDRALVVQWSRMTACHVVDAGSNPAQRSGKNPLLARGANPRARN